MRLAPVVMFYAAHPAQAMDMAAQSSRTTHGAPVAVDACRYLAALMLGAMRGESKEALLAPRYTPIAMYWDAHPLHPVIDAIAAGSFLHKAPPAIRGSGYVAHSLEAALWAFANSSDFRTGCLLAVNLGEDADTTAAIYGQLAGAFYGAAGIPPEWRQRLTHAEMLEDLAEQLARAGALGN